jgi:hypothetical protein
VGNDRPRLHLVFEALNFELIFPEKDHIIEYAQGRASVCFVGNRILDSIGKPERRWQRLVSLGHENRWRFQLKIRFAFS